MFEYDLYILTDIVLLNTPNTGTLRELGEKTIALNYNPETVSTDYDESDRLYFEEISDERVMDIVDVEGAKATIVSVGGQAPNNMALKLHQNGVNILGTHPEMIDRCEDRNKYSSMLDEIGVKQPAWSALTSMDDAYVVFERENFNHFPKNIIVSLTRTLTNIVCITP